MVRLFFNMVGVSFQFADPQQYFFQYGCVELVKNILPFPGVADEVGFLKDGQVTGDGCGGDVEMVGDVSRRHSAGFEKVQDFPADWVGKSAEGLLESHGVTSFPE